MERLCRRFVEQMLTSEPGSVLGLVEAYAAFNEFLKLQNLAEVKRSDFKAAVAPLIAEQFNVCLRNDLKLGEHSGMRGWKNVRYVGRTVPG